MQFVDKALARRFESGEEAPQVEYAHVFQKTRPEIGAAVEEICGGHRKCLSCSKNGDMPSRN